MRRAVRVASKAVAIACVAFACVACVDAKQQVKQENASSSANSHSDKQASSPPGPGASTLVNVQIVSRHGTRAPNPVVAHICPAERPNLARYADLRLTLAGLTGTGQKELYALGTFTRQTYIERTYPHFISNFFNDEQVYFRAVGEDRTIQSAVCMGHGMYPKGTAAIGYFTDEPSPVPVYTLPDDMDALLEVRKHGCADRLKKDAAAWDETEGMKLYRENEHLIERLLQMCNITDLNEQIIGSGDNYGDAIKDITDAWTFDLLEGLDPIPGLNYSSLLEFRTMAVKQLLGRIVGTEEQIVYLNGELPERLVDNFHTAISAQGPPDVKASEASLKMYAYHGHREMMYALGAFLGIDYDIKFPGLPKGGIPPATTLFFELHYLGDDRDKDGNPPNPWNKEGLMNPYEHRMVRPEDMPKPHVWGAPEDDDQEAEEAARRFWTPKNGTIPTGPSRVTGWPSRGGEGELNGRRRVNQPTETEAHHPPTPANSGQDQGQVQKQGEATNSTGSNDQSQSHQLLQIQSPDNNSNYSSRVGENELEGKHQGDEASDTEKHKYKKKDARDTSPSKPSNSARSVLPRVINRPSTGLVKIPDSHMPRPPVSDYVVRAFVWHPCGDESIQETPAASKSDRASDNKKVADCPATPVQMRAICGDKYECTMEDFRTKMEARVRRTGTWSQLCGQKQVERITADVDAVGYDRLQTTEQEQEQERSLVDAGTDQRESKQAAQPSTSDDHAKTASEDSHATPSAVPESHWLRWTLLGVLALGVIAGIWKFRTMTAGSSYDHEYAPVEERTTF